jgi:hypothetical protein
LLQVRSKHDWDKRVVSIPSQFPTLALLIQLCSNSPSIRIDLGNHVQSAVYFENASNVRLSNCQSPAFVHAHAGLTHIDKVYTCE